jgi:hypothetical protein
MLSAKFFTVFRTLPCCTTVALSCCMSLHPLHLRLRPVLQQVSVTLEASGGHSSMPPIDGSSIGDRLGAFLSAMTASPPQPHLVAPTRELLEGLLDLAGPRLAVLAWIIKVSLVCWVALPFECAKCTLMLFGPGQRTPPYTHSIVKVMLWQAESCCWASEGWVPDKLITRVPDLHPCDQLLCTCVQYCTVQCSIRLVCVAVVAGHSHSMAGQAAVCLHSQGHCPPGSTAQGYR